MILLPLLVLCRSPTVDLFVESDPRALRDELIQRCVGNVGVRRVAGRVVGRERGQRCVSDQKDVEVAREILIAGRRPGRTTLDQL